jgi:hypothetical protein
MPNIVELAPRIDRRLANAWDDLVHFCHQSNVASYTGQRFTRRTYDNIMISIQYRLHHMPRPTDSLSRALHAGMLILISSLYFGWQYHKPEDQHRLAQPLSDALQSLSREAVDCPDLISFWLIMLWKSLVPHELSNHLHNVYLAETAAKLHLRSWDQAETVLRSMAWISAVHGPRGSSVFHYMLNHRI